MMQYIGLFCAASQRLEPKYYQMADALGRWLGRNGRTLVYGGANSGLMESAARAVSETGGKVVGIVPSMLEANRRVSTWIDELVPCSDLNERKRLLMERSDILVALPGGIGTLDEVFTVMASHSIGYHSKRVVLYSEDGFWDGLLQVLAEMDRRHFINRPLEGYLSVAHSLDELSALL